MNWNPRPAALRWRIKPLVFLLSLAPFVYYTVALFSHWLGANPVEAITRASGDWALRFLLISLAVTPLRKLLGWNWLIRLRRMLGLFAFFYAAVHLMLYAWLDQLLDLMAIWEDVIERPFITAGMVSMLILLALALTSPTFMVRRLGRNWARLHKCVYLAAILAVLHFWWMKASKVDVSEPLLYAVILSALLMYRWFFWRNQSRNQINVLRQA